MNEARYDGLADWFDREFATGPRSEATRETLLRLIGNGNGHLIDVGCGTGAFSAAVAERGWQVTGVDVSADQLRLARERGLTVVQADAAALPFGDASFDAAVSTWTHTDIDNFASAVCEIARVLRPGAPFVYFGAHPCFVGPHASFVGGEGVPELFSGYRRTERYDEAPGITADGVRARVGATHLPLGHLLQVFVDADFRLDRVEEPEGREYPYQLALRWRR